MTYTPVRSFPFMTHVPTKLDCLTKDDLPFKRKIHAEENIAMTRGLHTAFYSGNRDTYEALVEENIRRVVAYGIIADVAGEQELALNLFSRARNQAHYKYVKWRASGKSKADLATSLTEYELSPIIGIMVNQGDFDTANRLRGLLREYKRKSGDYHEAAKLSYSMQDWKGVGEDLRGSCSGDGAHEISTEGLLLYARTTSKRDKPVSDLLYAAIEKRAQEEGHWGLLGMVLSETGRKRDAITAYERGKKFFVARNLRKNLGLSTKGVTRKALEARFHQERLDNHCQAFYAPYPEHLERTMKAAKRLGAQSLLEDMLRKSGFYFTLGEIGEELGCSQDYRKLAAKIKSIEEWMSKERWGLFYQENPRSTDIINFFVEELRESCHSDLGNTARVEKAQAFLENPNPSDLFNVLGFPEDVADFLVLGCIRKHLFPTQELEWGRSVPVFAEFGLDAVKSLFDSKRYELLVEGVPTLAWEEEGESVESRRNCDNPLVVRDLDIQKEILPLVRTAGKRLRRRYSELDVNVDPYRGPYMDEAALERMRHPDPRDDLPF